MVEIPCPLLNRFTDTLCYAASFDKVELRRRMIPNPELAIVGMRYTAAADNKYLNRLFEYTRSRMRIARASALNFPLISISLLVYFWPGLGTHALGLKPGIVLLIVISGILFTGLALFSWQRFTRTYLQLVRENSDTTASKSKLSPLGS